MQAAPRLTIRPMTPLDIPLGMRLKEIAGWNQTPADWEGFLQIAPGGCFVAELDGTPVGTSTAIDYQGRFGWIGMVLVDPAARRQGIATRLVEHCIEYLEQVGCRCQKLDATDAGAHVYGQLGFQTEYAVERWQGRVTSAIENVYGSRLEVPDLTRVLALDRKAFGASRQELLEWYCRNEAPRYWSQSPSGVRGYVVGRPGSRVFQVGPLVAGSAETAGHLMRRMLKELGDREIIADVAGPNEAALRLVGSLGLERRRVLKRMFRGPNRWPGRPDRTFCLAGFEFG